MGDVQSTTLNTDTDAKRTSSEFGDRGDGTSRWFQWKRVANGGDTAQGATSDAAVTDPTAAGSVVALLKGLLTALRISPAGLLKAEDAAAVSGDSGVMALAVRRDSPTSDAAAGDYHALHVDALGRLRVTGTQIEDAAHTSGDAGSLSLAVRRDAAAAGVDTDGDYAALAVDALGRLHVTQPKPVKASTTALAASLIVKASAGRLFRVLITNTGAAQFAQIHDTTTVPADTAVPAMVVALPAGETTTLDLGAAGLAFATGITVCNSSTAATKTIGSADLWIDALYE